MESKNMFWEVWRNVALATSNWGLGSGNSSKKDRTNSSKSTKKSRYHRLISSPSPVGGPKKSMSQPVNLTRFTDFDSGDENFNGEQVFESSALKSSSSQLSPSDISDNNKQMNKNTSDDVSSKSGGVKRSFSSFLPFSSCSLTGSSSVKTPTIVEDQTLTSINNTSEDNTKEDAAKPQEKTVTSNVAVISASTENFNLGQTETIPVKECTNQQCGLNKDVIIDYWGNTSQTKNENIELPACEVCARAFPTIRQLAAHQRRKRHYGCIECDSIFPSKAVLECHREQMCHYEFAVDMYNIDEGDLNDEEDFFESEDEENIKMWEEDEEECEDEEMERLL